MRKVWVFVGMIAVSMLVLASAAFAVDYPPTVGPNSVVTVSPAQAAAAQQTSAASAKSGGLPFTGGNTMLLVWIAVACIAIGAFFVSRARRNRTA